jgi:WD40 repeat protein
MYLVKNINVNLFKSNIKNINNSNKNEKSIDLMEFSFDSLYLASKNNLYENIIFIWYIPTLTLNSIIIFNNNINDFKWSPSENKLIIATKNLAIYIYSINNIYIFNLPIDSFNFNKIIWNEDGEKFLIQDKNKIFICYSDIEE